jgi:hypothetical protein
VELPRYRLNPGLDIRYAGTASGVYGLLTGPRISGRFEYFQPYAEALFGVNHANGDLTLSNGSGSGSTGNGSPQDVSGIASVGVVGLDLRGSGVVHWRVLELSGGSYTGLTGSTLFTISSGVVVQFP